MNSEEAGQRVNKLHEDEDNFFFLTHTQPIMQEMNYFGFCKIHGN